MGWYGGIIAAVDLATGDTAWTLKPDSFSNNEGRIVADSAGNVWWGSFGGDWVQSADSEGNLRFSFPACAVGDPTEVRQLGPIDAEGTLYALNTSPDSTGDDDLRVSAINEGGGLPHGTCPQEEQRVEGTNRFATGIQASMGAFPQDGSADAVVLARSDHYADALAGTPLAVKVNGPLLINPTSALRDDVKAEIVRLLGDDTSKVVYLLGGTSALSATVEAQVDALGYQTKRIFGSGRVQTAIEVAKELGEVEAFLITTGFNYPDALAAGVAAANVNGAVMLTQSEKRNADTDAFMGSRPSAKRYAIGGPAARPYSEVTPVFGKNRSETAALSPAPSGYLCEAEATIQRVFVYGGTSAVSDAAASAAEQRIQGQGC